ncbi:hypothetical protein PVT71_28325 (plasmid) [Salipiger sp. H15]|uniref:Anaphase-promoting complex subunit 4-like WD40 domain-containing protein n=1 Tax=Alloyangia sp. H15 TaxID=3029062 RepID=A0AAU8ASE4_9RHOB
MTHHGTPQGALSLFDLIGRAWDLGCPVAQLVFNASQTAVAAPCSDGSVRFLPVADSEHPETRMRVEFDTGRMSIRPRKNGLPAAFGTGEPVVREEPGMCRLGTEGFAAIGLDGGLWRATARGQFLRIAQGSPAPFDALCDLPGEGGLAAVQGSELKIFGPDGAALPGSVPLAHGVRRLRLSPDGRTLACWRPGSLTLVDLATAAVVATVEGEGDLLDLAWSPDGRWIAGGCREKALLLYDTQARQADRIVDFPAPVGQVAFSAPARALIASGAFRTVGWRLPDLPFGDHGGEAIETGRAGLTLVEAVAAHPARDLCAVGYANGLVTLSRIGQRDEMMLREGTGRAVTALSWSADGSHLALGSDDGTAAIVTFPKSMFK